MPSPSAVSSVVVCILLCRLLSPSPPSSVFSSSIVTFPTDSHCAARLLVNAALHTGVRPDRGVEPASPAPRRPRGRRRPRRRHRAPHTERQRERFRIQGGTLSSRAAQCPGGPRQHGLNSYTTSPKTAQRVHSRRDATLREKTTGTGQDESCRQAPKSVCWAVLRDRLPTDNGRKPTHPKTTPRASCQTTVTVAYHLHFRCPCNTPVSRAGYAPATPPQTLFTNQSAPPPRGGAGR